jgi:hypothetical protein
VSTCTPLPKDPIFISAAPPKRADTGRILTTRAPTLGRRIAGHSVGAGPCPRRANAISPARTTVVPVAGNRRQTCRNAAPPYGSFLAEPGNSLFLPVLATKIPCSGWAGNLCLTRWNRCANPSSTSAGWREKSANSLLFSLLSGKFAPQESRRMHPPRSFHECSGRGGITLTFPATQTPTVSTRRPESSSRERAWTTTAPALTRCRSRPPHTACR